MAACPSNKKILNFACPGQVLVYLLFSYLRDDLPEPPPIRRVRMKHYLTWQEDLCVPDNGMALSLSPLLGYLHNKQKTMSNINTLLRTHEKRLVVSDLDYQKKKVF